MATKNIRITAHAYEALRATKVIHESFSQTILRITKRKPLSAFFGVLWPEPGRALEQTIVAMRKSRNASHRRRLRHLGAAYRKRKRD